MVKNKLDNPPPSNNNTTPWLIVLLYALAISLDWLFAYYVQAQPSIIISSWSVLFPFFTFFYSAFSMLALIGIFQKMNWGFSLGYVTLMVGAILSSISFLHAYKIYGFIETLFIFLLVINLIIFICMLYYCQSHRIRSD